MLQSPRYSRRDFLNFMGRASLGVGLAGLWKHPLWGKSADKTPVFKLSSLGIHRDDSLKLAEGFSSEIFIRYGDVINPKGDRFGFNNDFIAMIPMNAAGTDALMWVNHEE